MPSIQFGWIMPISSREVIPQGTLVSDLQKGLALVNEHFASAWAVDHLQYEDTPLMEGWTALTYMAALQPKLKFGNAVLSQSFRNPALLAKIAASFPYMSGCCFFLGIGGGSRGDESSYQQYRVASG